MVNNKGFFCILFLIGLLALSCSTSSGKQLSEQGPSSGWRSSLYPVSWEPGFSDSMGRFLHDFSYAGYHKGEQEPEAGSSLPVLDVTGPPYFADNTASVDATSAIQKALNDAGLLGGAIVYLPAGTYLVSPAKSGLYASSLSIRNSFVVLRGEGPDKTFLLNSETWMRSSNVIRILPQTSSETYWNYFYKNRMNEVSITAEYTRPTQEIQVFSTEGFNLGDWIVIVEECNEAMIKKLNMAGKWKEGEVDGPAFYRQITAISEKTLHIDIPTRFPLLEKYNPTVFIMNHRHLEEVGIEDLSIGMMENRSNGFMDDNDFSVKGTAAYEVHGSHAIDVRFTVNGWIKNVHSFRPSGNKGDFHLLSNGIRLTDCRNVSILNCDFKNPQYEGNGGNGYMYTLSSNDCLIQECTASGSRHNYDFKYMRSNGNVITRSTAADSRFSSDFHMYLSMANLFDCMTMDGDWLQAVYRPYERIEHGQSTTESVFWNTTGLSYHSTNRSVVESQQWGWGYIIGTQGPAYKVKAHSDGGRGTNPADFIEGEGLGASLIPESLYESQLAQRIKRESTPQP